MLTIHLTKNNLMGFVGNRQIAGAKDGRNQRWIWKSAKRRARATKNG